MRRPFRTPFPSIAGLVALAMVALACGSGGGNASSQPSPTAAAAARPDLSKDDLGRSVTVPAAPKRVVAMSPSVVELMFAVGATPAGRPTSADFPEAAKSVPSFGLAYPPINYEEIVAMKPDLIIADAIIDEGVINELARIGPVFAVRVSSFDEVTRGLRVVGALTGNASAGEREAANLQSKLAQIKAKLPAKGPTVLVLVSAGPGQFIAEKDSSYLADLIKKLGGTNLVTSEPDNFRFPGFTDYSRERIVEKNPDVIITVSLGGPPGTPKTSDVLKADSALATLTAVKSGRVYEVDAFIYVQSAGPRVGIILDELPRILYPDVFKGS